ncbi:hypothetical protein A3D00_05670 [Candidatus Woesebacteria bacterium RIFCSPHIGHO2_02_FULL_38_9]|nr:MAG: hypothetical protein A3D00_05670 [Candidatus Woesebacteria bacterium RIFCSPHIGHO2_02_FULL_38_9]OGM57021.1 MAG: hypothetical protein A3A50_03490 [Candidatus Woesebacteria bacterium RIFCSPLOWO2_01_FULL_38_20]
MIKLHLNKEQSSQAGKYFLDISKITFSVLVLGLLVSSEIVAFRLTIWYIGIVGSTLSFVLGLYFLKTKR